MSLDNISQWTFSEWHFISDFIIVTKQFDLNGMKQNHGLKDNFIVKKIWFHQNRHSMNSIERMIHVVHVTFICIGLHLLGCTFCNCTRREIQSLILMGRIWCQLDTVCTIVAMSFDVCVLLYVLTHHCFFFWLYHCQEQKWCSFYENYLFNYDFIQVHRYNLCLVDTRIESLGDLILMNKMNSVCVLYYSFYC